MLLAKELFKGYIWNRIPRKNRLLLGTLFNYGGKPAKFIKKRFSDEKIEFLLKLQWWNWSEEEIFNNLKKITSETGLEELINVIDHFIKHINKQEFDKEVS